LSASRILLMAATHPIHTHSLTHLSLQCVDAFIGDAITSQ